MESNVKKMREALDAVVAVGYPHNFQREAPHIRGYCYEITEAIEKCFAALSSTPRNCDVGTAEERMYRYNRLRDEINERYERLGEIPPSFAFPTAFEWEDSPYESEKRAVEQ